MLPKFGEHLIENNYSCSSSNICTVRFITLKCKLVIVQQDYRQLFPLAPICEELPALAEPNT